MEEFTAIGKANVLQVCSSSSPQICKRFAIHPYNPEEASAHRGACQERHAKLQDHLRGRQQVCSICLEKVLEKENPSDRKFGLMACDHVFCLKCIRTWRSAEGSAFDID